MKKRLRELFILLLITLTLLFVLEGTFRLLGFQPAKPLISNWMQLDQQLLWRNKPHSHGSKGSRFAPEISFVHNNLGLRMRNDVEPEHDGIFRIAVLGDSNIWGFGVEQAQTACSILQSKFDKEPLDNKKVEVLNLGTIGHSSYQGMRVVTEYMFFCGDSASKRQTCLAPDLVVLAYGYNDRRYVMSKEWQDSKVYVDKMYSRAKWNQRIFEHSAFCNIFMSYNKNNLSTTLKDAVPRVSLDTYKKNVKGMFVRSDYQGENNYIPVIVLGLRDNPAVTSRMEQAKQFEIEGNIANAVQIYLTILQSPNITESSLAPYLFLKLLKQKPNEVMQAVAQFTERQPSDHEKFQSQLENIKLPIDSVMGMTPIRPDWEYLDVLREVCSQYENAYFLDMRETLSELPREEQLKCFFATDPCHLNVKGQKLLADELEKLIRKIQIDANGNKRRSR